MSFSVSFPPKFREILKSANEEQWVDQIAKQKNPWKKLTKLVIWIINCSDWQNNSLLYRHAERTLGILFTEPKALDAIAKKKKLLRHLIQSKDAFHNAPQLAKATALQALLFENAAKKRRVESIHAGIENSHNDCFMISVIQALRHVPKFKECLTEANFSLPLKTFLFQIIKELDAGKTVQAETINTFRQASMKEGFIAESTNSQECALLFCQFLLQKIGYKNFEFQTAVSHALEFPVPSLDNQRTPANLISLPLGQAKDGTELKELLMANCVKEEVNINSIYASESVYLSEEVLVELSEFSKKEDVVDTLQTILLKSNEVPPLLVLGLRRFQFKDRVASKLKTRILPAPILKIATKAPDGKIALVEYHLKALVVHSGSTITSGHYYTFVTQRDRWLECNDARVVEHEDYKKQKRISDDKDSLTPYEESCQNGYLFFYQKM